jgi:hypothetical protein
MNYLVKPIILLVTVEAIMEPILVNSITSTKPIDLINYQCLRANLIILEEDHLVVADFLLTAILVLDPCLF